jgi:DNA-binding FadR family transcriptional regulator
MVDAIPKPTPLSLRATDRAPLSVQVSRRLREAIMSGELAMGSELPSEKELTGQLGVSRSTVREALRVLQAQGLLTGGDTVSTQRPRVTGAHTLGSAALAMETVLRLGVVPLRDLVDLRALIEGAALEQAAHDRSPEALELARQALEVMRTPEVSVRAFSAADVAFHQSLIGASGNAAFGLVMGVLREAISAHLGEALDRQRDARATMRALTIEHEAIYAAVAKGNGKRAQAMVSEHIRAFYAGAQR